MDQRMERVMECEMSAEEDLGVSPCRQAMEPMAAPQVRSLMASHAVPL